MYLSLLYHDLLIDLTSSIFDTRPRLNYLMLLEVFPWLSQHKYTNAFSFHTLIPNHRTPDLT